MSADSSPSPRHRPAQADESQLPQGHCRYILLMPELKGHRCGCAHFNLNTALPGASCECGHLACYHVNSSQPPSSSAAAAAASGTGAHDVCALEQRLQLLEKEHVELHQLRRDFMLLQRQLTQDSTRHHELIRRVSELEESAELGREEVRENVRGVYQNLRRAWVDINDLTQNKLAVDGNFKHINDALHDMDTRVSIMDEHQFELDASLAHIDEAQKEINEFSISLSERIDALETDDLEERIEALEKRKCAESLGPSTSRPATTLSSPQPRPVDGEKSYPGRSQSPTSVKSASRSSSASQMTTMVFAAPVVASFRNSRSPEIPHALPPPLIGSPPMVVPTRAANSNELWTVHISLMPSADLPFPFERDTNSYKRCLSRGLHKMVPVNGTTAEAFEAAVQKAFGGFLRGNPWMPLQALPCTAERLSGLPMLRKLPSYLLERPFDLDFLVNNSAVCDSNGKIDSLYIAMRVKTISWHSLRRAPVFLEGLEASWAYDSYLDPPEDSGDGLGDDTSEDEVAGGGSRPPAGDIVASLPSLKRAASEISRSSSYGPSAPGIMPAATTTAAMSAPEGEGSRPKMPRIRLPNIGEVRRGVKTT